MITLAVSLTALSLELYHSNHLNHGKHESTQSGDLEAEWRGLAAHGESWNDQPRTGMPGGLGSGSDRRPMHQMGCRH